MNRCILTYVPSHNHLALFANQGKSSCLITFDIDFKNNIVKPKGTKIYEHSNKTVTDIDMNKFVIANATSEAEVQLFNMQDLQEDPIYITCGSKSSSIKSYTQHPRRAGVSMVKVT